MFTVLLTVMFRDHSFLRNAEFWVQLWNLPFPSNFYVSEECCGIRYWPVIRGQIRHILVRFRWPWQINCLLYVENLQWWAAEFGKLARGIGKNLLRKSVVPSNGDLSDMIPVTGLVYVNKCPPITMLSIICEYHPVPNNPIPSQVKSSCL